MKNTAASDHGRKCLTLSPNGQMQVAAIQLFQQVIKEMNFPITRPYSMERDIPKYI
jgi:hypothetical protein